MTLDEISEMAQLVSSWTAQLVANEEVLSPSDRVNVWIIIDGLVDELRLALGDLASDATRALGDLGVGKGEWFHAGHDLVTMSTRRVGSDKWRGWALAGALAVELFEQRIDETTGEITREPVRAVPLDVVRAVVPGCAHDDLTWSRWSTRALRGLINPERFHVERSVSQQVIKRAGDKRYAVGDDRNELSAEPEGGAA